MKLSMIVALAAVAVGLSFRSALAESDFPVASELCPHVLGFDGDHMRYCRNRALDTVSKTVTRAVIVIPASESPAATYYKDVKALVDLEGIDATTTIIVPQFLEDNGEAGTPLTKLGLDSTYLFWTGNWRYGYKSQNRAKRPSYEIIDWIVRSLLANNPNLQHIAVVGHSAGAQFANGYAAGNAVEETAKAKGVTMSYGVSAPGRYMWLTTDRPGRVDQCSGFNDYPYGLDGIENNAYMNDWSVGTLRDRLLDRHIYYFVGDQDTDSGTSCENTQGPNRLQRQLNYRAHMVRVCGDAATECATYMASHDMPELVKGCYDRCDQSFVMKRYTIAGAEHNHNDTFGSAIGRKILFHWR